MRRIVQASNLNTPLKLRMIRKVLVKNQNLYGISETLCGRHRRWWLRQMLRVLPPKNILNVYLYLEQFLLRDNCEPIKQLLHKKCKRNHREKDERAVCQLRNPGSEEPGAPLFMFLPLGRRPRAPSRFFGQTAGHCCRSSASPSYSRNRRTPEHTRAPPHPPPCD